MHERTAVLAALPQPRHAASAAADVVASHGGLPGPVLLIEGDWTYALAISTGAASVFCAFQHAQPTTRALARRPGVEDAHHHFAV
jgi:ABC-type amino acid transport system permease subunit